MGRDQRRDRNEYSATRESPKREEAGMEFFLHYTDKFLKKYRFFVSASGPRRWLTINAFKFPRECTRI